MAAAIGVVNLTLSMSLCYFTSDPGHHGSRDDPCPTGSKYEELYFFDVDVKGCRLFWYTGCGGNRNRFRTREECERRCYVVDGNGAREVTTLPPSKTLDYYSKYQKVPGLIIFRVIYYERYPNQEVLRLSGKTLCHGSESLKFDPR